MAFKGKLHPIKCGVRLSSNYINYIELQGVYESED